MRSLTFVGPCVEPGSMIQKVSEPAGRPLVSAIIPAYNCERYVGRAIRSVLAQTYPHVECIVVDDGSTDGTASVIESFGDQVRRIAQRNAGASVARNAGIAAARGRYIAFLDSDDYWLPNKLELQVSIFLEDPDLVLVSSDLTWLDPSVDPESFDTELAPFDPERLERCSGLDDLLRDPYLGTPTVVVDARAAERIGGFDTDFPIAEDVDFYLRLCADRPFAILHLPLVRCQLRSGSLTTQLRGYACNLEVLDRLLRHTPSLSSAQISSIRARQLAIYSEWARSHIYRGQGHAAREVLRQGSAVGQLTDYAPLYLKSWLAPAIHVVRGWCRRMADRQAGSGG